MKITFLGDIMCEPPVLAGAQQKDGSYNFDYVFARAQGLIDEADYVVGNLETPMCAKEMGYCNDFADFGCPEAMADALKDAGVDDDDNDEEDDEKCVLSAQNSKKTTPGTYNLTSFTHRMYWSRWTGHALC